MLVVEVEVNIGLELVVLVVLVVEVLAVELVVVNQVYQAQLILEALAEAVAQGQAQVAQAVAA
jgi:hypothetical protein